MPDFDLMARTRSGEKIRAKIENADDWQQARMCALRELPELQCVLVCERPSAPLLLEPSTPLVA